MTAAFAFLLPSGEKVAGVAGRMRGPLRTGSPYPATAPELTIPLNRRAPRATFSPEGRRRVAP